MITATPNYSLLLHNTFGIDTTCKLFVEYNEPTDLPIIRQRYLIQENLNYYQIGSGSNLLFTSPFEGVVFHSCINDWEEVSLSLESSVVRVSVGPGMLWDDFVALTVKKGWSGAENLSYIPGEVGAAAVQNIGAYGVEVADIIRRVEAFDWKTGDFVVFQGNQCDYAYRYSRFKGTDNGRYAIVRVEFELSKNFEPKLNYGNLLQTLERQGCEISQLTSSQLRAAIIQLRKSKLPEPKELGNAGSFFMNPTISREHANQLLKIYPQMPHYILGEGEQVKVPAAWLIEQCGWKGKRFGRAGVYEKQPLVLVNHGGASSDEILQLCKLITSDVEKKFNIKLNPEVNFI